MLITDPNLLKQYNTPKRLWQGIPSIEVTPKGRIFLTFYAGGVKEQIGNFAMVSTGEWLFIRRLASGRILLIRPVRS